MPLHVFLATYWQPCFSTCGILPFLYYYVFVTFTFLHHFCVSLLVLITFESIWTHFCSFRESAKSNMDPTNDVIGAWYGVAVPFYSQFVLFPPPPPSPGSGTQRQENINNKKAQKTQKSFVVNQPLRRWPKRERRQGRKNLLRKFCIKIVTFNCKVLQQIKKN